jgi:hypothetical protein
MRNRRPRFAELWLMFILLAGCGSQSNSGAGTDDAGSTDADRRADRADPASMEDAGPGADLDAGATADVRAGDAAHTNGRLPTNVGAVVVDQFGYRTADRKIAVVRSSQVGVGSPSTFVAGPTYALVDEGSGQRVLEAAPVPNGGGATDPSSGDRTWQFDFSSITAAGQYHVLDETTGVRSASFRIADDVYSSVLQQAVRMFYYQRDTAKPATYAGAGWADTAEHPQDATCSLHSDGSGSRDLRGGWFDGGDQSKYAGWSGRTAIGLLRAYVETPGAFGDATGIPESGNGVPDILDEVKWGLDWVAQMQSSDGSVLSVVSHAGGSPPSADTAPCTYGPASTSVTLSAAAAFAYGAVVFGSVGAAGTAYPGYASALATRAQNAWTWASSNQGVTFDNQANGIGTREQEVDAAGLAFLKVQAATMLFELSPSTTAYRDVVDGSYTQLQTALDPYALAPVDALLGYTKLPGATPSTVASIMGTFRAAVVGPSGLIATAQSAADPYMAYLPRYVWGSNGAKADQGNVIYDRITFNVDSTPGADASTGADASSEGGTSAATATRDRAESFVHYLHGVNPLGEVYLSNMGGYGATNSVTRFFSYWFSSGWVDASTYGPPPGFLVAGPNPTYSWDGCCPTGCGSTANNLACGSSLLSPPAMQPDQKSYADISDNWPIDSWTVTEPNDVYQIAYIRLLSKFTM